jgi:hypothetical protein
MRQVVLGILVLTLLGFVLLGWSNSRGELQAQQVPPAVKPLVLADGLIALSSDTADGRQQVAVIDSKTRVMSVYHIEHKTGAISLTSVRSLAADLEMEDFNTLRPFPSEIRAMLNKR